MGLQPLTDASVCNETIRSHLSYSFAQMTLMNSTDYPIGCIVIGARFAAFNIATEGARDAAIHQVCAMGKCFILIFFIFLRQLYNRKLYS